LCIFFFIFGGLFFFSPAQKHTPQHHLRGPRSPTSVYI
jgi:hypothetical protein